MKFFRKTDLLTGEGHNGVFHRDEDKTCCGQSIKGVFGTRSNILEQTNANGTAAFSTNDCCDTDTREEIYKKGA